MLFGPDINANLKSYHSYSLLCPNYTLWKDVQKIKTNFAFNDLLHVFRQQTMNKMCISCEFSCFLLFHINLLVYIKLEKYVQTQYKTLYLVRIWQWWSFCWFYCFLPAQDFSRTEVKLHKVSNFLSSFHEYSVYCVATMTS